MILCKVLSVYQWGCGVKTGAIPSFQFWTAVCLSLLDVGQSCHHSLWSRNDRTKCL